MKKLFEGIQLFLSNKKTHIVAFTLFALNVAVGFGWVDPQHLAQINVVLAACGLSALRAGVAKNKENK